MAFFLLDGGGKIMFVPDQEGRFHMRQLAASLQASPDRIQITGLVVPCQEDGRSLHTLQELRLCAQLAGSTEDGSFENPFVLSVQGVKPQKLAPTDAITAPSSAAEVCAVTFEKLLFYDFRPAKALPLGIFVKAVGLVRDALGMDPRHIQPRAWRFVRELREDMPAAFPASSGRPEEARRQAAFTNRLRSYIADTLGAEFIVVSNKEPSQYHMLPLGKGPDIKIFLLVGKKEVLLIASIVVKPEIGFNGEPSLENLLYYSHQVSNCSHKDIYYTGYPMLLMELVGPNLRLAGAYFMDKAVFEPMTPFLSLLQLHDPSHLRQLGCMVTAIPIALTALKEIYRNAPSRPKVLRTEGVLFWPYRLQELYPAANLERLFAGKAIFRVTEAGRSKVVKFVQERYGEEAHRQWASCGHAPEFELEELPGSWKMITMPWLGEDDGWLNLEKLRIQMPSQWRTTRPAVEKALLKVQSETTQLMAHGDIRAPNVFCNSGTGEVMFIDYDWAGPSGSVCYPPLLNQDLVWPDGVKGNVPILAQHDREALDIMYKLE